MTRNLPLRRFLSRLLLAVLLLAIFVRLGPKDRWVATGFVFYAAPWVMIALGFGVLAALARQRLHLLPAFVCLALWVLGSWGPGGGAPREGDIRLRLWNAFKPQSNFENLTLHVLKDDPALVFLTETTAYGRWAQAQGPERVGGRKVRYLGGGFSVMVSPAFDFQEHPLVLFDGGSRHVIVDVFPRGGEPFAVLLLDLDQNPLAAKEPLLRRIAQDAAAHPLPVRLVLGDFNLPGDSIWFSRLEGYRSAFRECGRGLEVSWPWPLPVLGLDQVWGDETVTFRHAEYGPANGSDHRKLDVMLSIPSRR